MAQKLNVLGIYLLFCKLIFISAALLSAANISYGCCMHNILATFAIQGFLVFHRFLHTTIPQSHYLSNVWVLYNYSYKKIVIKN